MSLSTRGGPGCRGRDCSGNVGRLYKAFMATRSRSTTSATKLVASAKRGSLGAKPQTKQSAVAASKPEVRLFVSYSHVDSKAQAKLKTHLTPWEREGVKVWHDENLEPGASLDREIARELRRAHIFVALLSPSYLASHYCWDIEYRRAMNRLARKTMRVVGVVVRPCAWKRTRAAGYKLLPRDGRPPELWASSDAAYLNVAEGIDEVIKAVRRELATQPAKPPGTAAKLKAVKAKVGRPKKVTVASTTTKAPATAKGRAKRKN